MRLRSAHPLHHTKYGRQKTEVNKPPKEEGRGWALSQNQPISRYLRKELHRCQRISITCSEFIANIAVSVAQLLTTVVCCNLALLLNTVRSENALFSRF